MESSGTATSGAVAADLLFEHNARGGTKEEEEIIKAVVATAFAGPSLYIYTQASSPIDMV